MTPNLPSSWENKNPLLSKKERTNNGPLRVIAMWKRKDLPNNNKNGKCFGEGFSKSRIKMNKYVVMTEENIWS